MRKAGRGPVVRRPVVLNWIDPTASTKPLSQEGGPGLLDDDRFDTETYRVQSSVHASGACATYQQAPELFFSCWPEKS
jgi:hypothetical protein